MLLGGLLMIALLAGQGALGLAPPLGTGSRLAGVLPAYVGSGARAVVAWLMVAAMVGWLGFNVGLGGAALGSLAGLPGWAGALLLGLVLIPVGLAGRDPVEPAGRGHHHLRAVAGAGRGAAVGLGRQRRSGSGRRKGALLAGVAAFVGYGSVFAVRAPDFTAGMRGRSDLAICIALLVGPTLAVAVCGSMLWQSSGSTDLVAELERSTAGTVLVIASVVAPALTSYHSGGFALTGVTGLSERTAVLAVALAGTALAAAGFHHYLVPWLVLLAAALPPLVVALGTEGWRRRRGWPPRVVPVWTWLPASAAGLVLTAAGVPAAALGGLALAVLLTTAGVRVTEPTTGSVRR